MCQDSDIEKILAVLLHDVRTPLGVATGYLRLMQQGQLATDADRARALDKAQDALGRMARCFEEAAALSDTTRPDTRRVLARDLITRVALDASSSSIGVRPSDIAGYVVVGEGIDPLAAAIVRLLATGLAGTLPEIRVDSAGDGETMEFWVGRDRAGSAVGQERVPYDPWERGGLTRPLAWQTIRHVGGEVWTTTARDVLIVSLTLETADS